MPANFNPPGYRWFHFFRNAPIRVGLYAGVWLALVFVAWVLIANRAAFLDPLAQQRNAAATMLLAVIAAVPVFRVLRAPWELLVSGLRAWSVLTVGCRIVGLVFVPLQRYHTPLH